MSLTKEDLSAIKEIVSDDFNMLAEITSNTFDVMEKRFAKMDVRFDAVDKRFDAVDKRFDAVDKRFVAVDKRFDSNDASHRNISAHLDLIETDLSSLRSLHTEVREIRRMLENAVTRQEFKAFEIRLVRVEKQLKLSSAR